jgi:Flp pilus assembly protein CpaB
MAQLTKPKPSPGPVNERTRIKAAPVSTRSSKVFPALAAVVLMGLGGLVAAWSASRGDAPTPVVMLIRDLAKGDTLTAADVAQLNVRVDQSVAAVPWSRLNDVLNKKIIFDASKGTIITKRMLAGVVSLPPGQVIVGAVLKPGEIPILGLRQGDRVDVLLTPGGTEPGQILVSNVEVFEVRSLADNTGQDATVSGSQTSEKIVSLLIPEDKAAEVGTAAKKGELRLAARGV